MTDVRTVVASDWFNITGRGIVAALADPHSGDGIRNGDLIRFDPSSRTAGKETNLISFDAVYEVTGIEESWGLTDPPVLTGRSLCIKPHANDEAPPHSLGEG